MAKAFSIGFLLFLSLMAGILLSGCRKDPVNWKPEVIMVLKPDSGLTTQTFDFKIDIPNLPTTQNEFYVRWDLNGDSAWDEPFTAIPVFTHRFYQKGIHAVKAEVLTKDGQRILLNRNIRVDQGYSAPHASFTIDPPESNYLTKFTFDASSTFDDEEPFSSLLFRWDFEDDGRWDTEAVADPIARHTYKKSQNYSVRLSVTDPTKRTESVSKILVVSLKDSLIRAGFNWLPVDGTVRDTFFLDASSTRHETDSSRVFSYTWDIQSEIVYGPFTDPVFEHVFWSSGWQKVTLTVTDQFGLSNQIMKEFFVIKENKPPVPKIQFATPYGNITTNFFFTAWLSLDDVTAPSDMMIRWDFEGDGVWDTGWSSEMELFHQFTQPGDYWVTMEAEDEGGERGITKTLVLVSSSTAQTSFIKDRRDGKYYGTVKIGDQWWMSDNLDYRTNPKMNIQMLQKCYGDPYGQCDLYGALYQGERAVVYTESGKNICPDGWRLPSKQDWLKLGEQVPATGGRDAMLVGGSMGFNGRYTGYMTFQFIYDPYDSEKIIDTLYFSDGITEEVKFLSTTTRPYQFELQAQFYMGLQRKFDGVDLLWGDLNGYFYARCIKND